MADLNINKNLINLRKLHNLTQDEVAQKLGVTNQAVSKWESGACCPDIALLPEIASLFDVSIDTLFGIKRIYSEVEQTEKIKWRDKLFTYFNAWVGHMTNGNSDLAFTTHIYIETILNPSNELHAAFQQELRNAVEEIKIDQPLSVTTQRMFAITPFFQKVYNE